MKKKISLIIPFYNEEKELKKIFEDISKFEKTYNLIDEYIFIDDCSSDTSNLICKNLIKSKKYNLKKKVSLYKNKKNFGWAKTLRRGYNLSRNNYCLYIPGDGEAKICQFLKKNIIKRIDFNNDLIIFQREKMSSRPFLRIIISKIYKILLYLIFPIKIIDLNGLLMIKKKKVKILNLFSNSFFISAEIIIKSFLLGFKIDSSQSFILMQKEKYKSTSLNVKQCKLVLIDLLKLIYYSLNFRFNKFKKNVNN
jgi:glycosyltransferase involved in cell wall biosynthesis